MYIEWLRGYVRVRLVRGFLIVEEVFGLHGLSLRIYEFRRDYSCHRGIAGF
jgi:hypothetical protein